MGEGEALCRANAAHGDAAAKDGGGDAITGDSGFVMQGVLEKRPGRRGMSIARWQRRHFVLQGDGGEFVCDETSVERALVKPHCPISAACCQDDYEHWSSRGCNPAGGKPVWVTAEDSTEHPIFFDDNIHNSTEDSIVAVRVRPDTSTPHYAALSGQDTLALHGLILVRTPSFAPILDPSWFLRKIEACEQAMLKARTAAAGGGWCPQSARD